jgi:predicted dehydrogenase
MREIRLAVSDPEEASRARIAARLRGANVEACCANLSDFRGPPEGCDAVMLTRPWLPVPGEIEHLLAAGAHVLLVANPCPPLATIETLTDCARKFGAQLSVVNPDHYLPSRRLIREQLTGPLGQVGLLRLHRWEAARPERTTESTVLPNPLLLDLDLALWLVGRRPEFVHAVGQDADAAGRYVQVHLGFPHGGMALLDFTNRLPAGDSYHSLSVIAANGAAYADDHQNTQLLYTGGRPRGVRTEEYAGQLGAMAQEFVDALREGRDLSAGLTAWRDAFAVSEAARGSLASGRAVALGGS